ncbi:MAG: bacillithiol system redox-active protein YtxJ [Croceitalea sp.]|nr:bacillithiol system redox-active protein YtxJ [Croceitalea sp.]NNC34142.1 bacillithiol system redox-active protein YtxJ [Croceitalea sp.]NNL07871.1 bacillithiol system redox-active protein YtxJ [Croceitalea sp.]
MGILTDLFGKRDDAQNDERSLPWIQLQTTAQIDGIIQNSRVKPQLIFKHSTTCGTSRMALNMFTSTSILKTNQFDFCFLDIHRYRPVSNAIADRFEIRHESPQLLIIKNEKVVYHCSHGEIAQVNLDNYA